ncbi:polysaccharide deacetylase family protein [Pseudonocardia ailaonensis]|uniref:polysaccharide deacetylase family protein n=1 Tax=Pseudonocardia ailaonensis TaxID=367279 RepID=UPI0031E3B412
MATRNGLFRGVGAERVPALLAALVLGLVAPLGAVGPHDPVTPAEEVAAAQDAPPAAQPAPVSSAKPVVLTDIPLAGPGDRRIALTFDDGPDPKWTPQVVNALVKYGAKGTFCMVGSQMEKNPEVVSVVVNAGMRICAHSRTHDEQLAKRDPATIEAEITDVGNRVPGTPVTYFRAPGGNWDKQILDVSVAHAMQPLGWAVDPRDWSRPGTDAIVAAVQKQVKPGAVILLHDGGGTRSQTVEALEKLLPWLAAQGYTTDFP